MAQHRAQPQWSRPPPPPPSHPPGARATHHRSRRPHWRVLTWVILAFNLLMLVWLITGVDAASNEGENCVGEACEAGNDIGTALGAGAIIFVWAAGAVILGVLWLVTGRGARREPRDRRW